MHGKTWFQDTMPEMWLWFGNAYLVCSNSILSMARTVYNTHESHQQYAEVEMMV